MTVKEIFKDALPLVEEFAPSIAAALHAPLGAAFLGAILLYNEFFEKYNDFTKDKILPLVEKILTDPESPQKLKDIEVRHGTDFTIALNKFLDFNKAEIDIKLEK